MKTQIKTTNFEQRPYQLKLPVQVNLEQMATPKYSILILDVVLASIAIACLYILMLTPSV